MACCTGICLCTSDECKDCRTCKDRCASFGLNSDLESACKRGCEADSNRYYTVDEFLSGTEGYQTPQEIADGIALETYQQEVSEAGTNKLIKIAGGIMLIMLIVLVAFLILRKKR